MFKAELPWLLESDRPIIDLAATIRDVFMRSQGAININQLQIYSAVLSKLGATPVDRSRTSPIAEPIIEDEFFGNA